MKENDKKNVLIIKCNYPVSGWPHHCNFKTPRRDLLELHIIDAHYLAEDRYIRLKLFGEYPNSCELCSDHEVLFSTPLDRFKHLVSEHLAFTLALCPICCRIFKGLSDTNYQYHRKCYHSTRVLNLHASRFLRHEKEQYLQKNQEDYEWAKNWGRKVYLPFKNLMLSIEESLKPGGEPFDLEAYVDSIPKIGRDFIHKLLQLPKPEVRDVTEVSPEEVRQIEMEGIAEDASHLTKRKGKRKTEPGEDTGNKKKKNR